MRRILVFLLGLSSSLVTAADFYEDVPNNPKYSYWIAPNSNNICHDYSKPIRVLVATPYMGCFSGDRYSRDSSTKNCTTKNGRLGFLKGVTSSEIRGMTFSSGSPLNFDHSEHVLGIVQSIDKVGDDLFATFILDKKWWELVRRGYVYRSIEIMHRSGFFGGHSEFVGLALTKTPVIRKQDPLPQPCGVKARRK